LKDVEKALIPIIAMSGYQMPEDFQKVGMLGFNDWLVKPFGISDLLDKVDKVMKDPYVLYK
jgi:CheY-like chemotaxis protein